MKVFQSMAVVTRCAVLAHILVVATGFSFEFGPFYDHCALQSSARCVNKIGESRYTSSSLFGMGGGWENDSFLDGLGASEEEREAEEKAKYERFQEQKKRMDEMRRKQEEFFKTEKGKQFLKNSQRMSQGNDFNNGQGDSFGAGIDSLLGEEDMMGAGGGSRFSSMMRRAESGNYMKNDAMMQGYGLIDDDESLE